MECKPAEGELTDVVIVIHWRRQATETIDGKEYSADIYNTYSCSAPTGDFTPYENLTFEQVCGWLEAGMDVEAIDAALDSKIALQVNPPVVSLPLPWVNVGVNLSNIESE